MCQYELYQYQLKTQWKSMLNVKSTLNNYTSNRTVLP